MGIQISTVKVKGVADVVFCFDCTGSMSPVIDNVKAHVNSFAENLNTGSDQSAPLDWRMRAVGYGDLNLGEEMQNSNDFVQGDVEAFKSQVTALRGCGGGDEPESTLDAIIVAAKTSKWREKCHKIVVVFTDATALDIHPSTASTHAVNNLEELKKMLSENHIKLFLWGAPCDKYSALKTVPKAEINEMSNPHAELDSGTNMTKLLEQMAKTVSMEVISKTL